MNSDECSTGRPLTDMSFLMSPVSSITYPPRPARPGILAVLRDGAGLPRQTARAAASASKVSLVPLR